MIRSALLAFVCLTVACKKKEAASPPPATGSAQASGSTPPPPPPAPRLAGTKVTAVRCEIPGLGSEFKRSLQVDAHGTIYVFDDGRKPLAIKAGAGPCGLALAETLVDADLAFAADGTPVAAPAEPGPCASQRFATFSWRGTVAGGLAYVLGDNGHTLAVEDLAATPCVARAFSKTLPEGRMADIAATRDGVLLVDFHASGNDENAIWRYKLDGTLIDKIGLKPEGGSLVGWIDQVSPCADGVCALESNKLVVFDHAGALVGKYPVGFDAVDLVEVGGALYALVTFKDGETKGSDLVRFDGVYAN